MECPNCKKELADNAKFCPECGYDFTAVKPATKEDKKRALFGCLGCLFLIIFGVSSCVNSLVDETEQAKKNKFTQDEIKAAEDFITSLEATGLVKEIKNKCADGSEGCYYFIIDEHMWNSAANYETKEHLVMASEIYTSDKKPFKFVEGKGYNSGKKLFDIFGVKN